LKTLFHHACQSVIDGFEKLRNMPDGGTLTFRTRMEDRWVILEVEDTGTGMTEEVRRRCLEPFFTTNEREGSGLGLAMVYGIVKRHGGALSIKTQADLGTVVEIRFPNKRVANIGGPVFAAPAVALRVVALEN
jgi:signal transduction histidine kinase